MLQSTYRGGKLANPITNKSSNSTYSMMMTRRVKVCQSALSSVIAVALLSISLSSCINYKNSDNSNSENSRTWVQNGMVAISRGAPGLAKPKSDSSALGFVPATLGGGKTGSWISIDRTDNSVALMKNDQVVSTLKGEGVLRLEPGLYKVKHKQRSPLWYAPDSYFTSRHAQPPAEGDKNRFRRGALGDFVIFIDQDTPIHSGPLWLDEIGGIKMDEADLSKIYYSLEIGSAIEVK